MATRLLEPTQAPLPDTLSCSDPTPLIICFHGSGESCSPAWDVLASQLVSQTRLRVLLYERGPLNPKPNEATANLQAYLSNPASEVLRGDETSQMRLGGLKGPYLLIAHSYGGAFARMFLQKELKNVVGLVLVETGQEGGLDPKLSAAQLENCILGDKPLCVMRGNSFIGKWKELEEKEKASQALDMEAPSDKFRTERMMLQLCDEEDEKLKKAQLKLSRKHRFIALDNVGHHVIRDRPDEVVAAVEWVMENLVPIKRENWWSRVVEKIVRTFQ